MGSPLPSLGGLLDVPPDRLREFRSKGHTVLRQVASTAVIDAWRPVIHEVALAHAMERAPVGDRDTLERALIQSQNLWCVDARVRQFVFAPRFGKIAADLLGVDAVRIYHDQAVFKEAGGGYTPFHQDQYFFPLDRDAVVTMWMPLVPVPAEVGSMTFASGSHLAGDLGRLDISDESHERFSIVAEERGFPLETHGAMAAGDATFHAGWTLHLAPANPSNSLRAVMTIIFMADGLRGIEPQHAWHEKDYAKWLPGVEPGDLAAGPLNPVIWRRSSSAR